MDEKLNLKDENNTIKVTSIFLFKKICNEAYRNETKIETMKKDIN